MDFAFAFAPLLSSILHISASPFEAASCNGVRSFSGKMGGGTKQKQEQNKTKQKVNMVK